MKQYAGLFILAVGVCCSAQSARAQKISKDLANVDALSNVKVIVQWKRTPETSNHQKVLNMGGSLKAVHSSINAATYTVPASALNSLANDPDVAFISPDRPVKASLDYTAAAVNAAYMWGKNYTGAGIAVAVIDSGMNSSPDLTMSNKIIYNQDFTGEIKPDANVQNTNNAPDLYGHGNHVAGIIASSGKTSLCGNCTRVLKGIAYGANIVNLRVLDENGEGTDSQVIAAIEKAILLKNVYNIRVINLSLGRPVYESYTQDPLCQAVEQAWKAGIVVVVAAGNDGRDNSYGNEGYGTINAPGNDPYVITVGAMKTEGTYTRTDDLIASYSSKGPTQIDHVVKPDVVAPGNQVVSLLAGPKAALFAAHPSNVVPVSYYQGSNNGHASKAYFTLSGTSMATPVVSGGVADLLQAQPNLTPDQVKALIMTTAYKTFPASSTAVDPVSGQAYLSYYDIFTVGAGYLDLQAAFQNINTVPAGTIALSPSAVYNSTTGIVSLSVGSWTIWATKSLWGAQSVWSASELNGNQCVAAQKSVWGASGGTSADGSVSAQKSIWGAGSVWSSTSGDAAESSTIAINGEP